MTKEQILEILPSLEFSNLQDHCQFGFIIESMVELPESECLELFNFMREKTPNIKRFWSVLPNSYWGKIYNRINAL